MSFRWNELVKMMLLTIAYATLAKLTLVNLSLFNGNVSVAWLPSGLALAILLINGKMHWPGVFLGALIGNIMAGNPQDVSSLIALGNTLEALVACTLLTNLCQFSKDFISSKDYPVLIFVGAVSSIVSAGTGVLTLWIYQIIPQSAIYLALFNWWQGDTLGIILITPLIMIWRHWPYSIFTLPRLVEFSLGLGLMCLVANIVFLDRWHDQLFFLTRGYWMFIFVSWAAMRFGRHGVSLVVVLTATFALYGIAHGTGYFAHDFQDTHLLNFWIYITTLTMIGFALAFSIEERQKTFNEIERSKQLIAQAEEHSHLLLQAAGEGIYGLDLQGLATFANPACCRMLGYSVDELIGQPMHSLIHHSYPDGKPYPRENCPMYAAFTDGDIHRITDEVLWRKDGSSIPVEYTSTPIWNKAKLCGAVIIFNDISQRKLAEDQLRESEAFQFNIINSVSDEIAVIDHQGIIKRVNEAWNQFSSKYGQKVDQLNTNSMIGTNYLEICKNSTGEGSEGSVEAYYGIKSVLEGQLPFFNLEYPCHYLHKHYWFQMKVTPLFLQGARGAVIAHSDVSDQKELETLLKHNETRFRNLADSAPVLIWTADTSKGCTWFNKTWLDFTGRPLAKELGNGWAEGVHADDFDRCIQIYLAHFDTRQPFQMEYRLRRFDGEYHWFIDVGKPHFSELGEFAGYIGMLTDINDRKNMEEAIRFRQFSLDHADEEVFWIDKNARILDANQTACQKLGYSQTEICKLTVADIDPHFPIETWSTHWSELKEMSVLRFESFHKTRDGEIFPIEIIANYFEYEGIEYNCALARDITQRKIFEKTLKEKTNYLNTILNSEPECVKVVAHDGSLLEMNQAGLKLLEVDSIEEVQQYGLVNFIVPEFRPLFQKLHHEVFQGKSATVEFRIEGKRGGRYWLDTHAAPLFDDQGKVKALVGVTRDITERIRLVEELEHQAKIDFLTGLVNRRCFLELSEQELVRARRYDSPMSILMMDIDFFKHINDNYGHKAGDQVLQKLASTCKFELREVDIIGRMGGEEFAILLPETPSQPAQEVAERLRLALYNTRVELTEKHTQIQFTVSLGVASMTKSHETLDALLQDADDALYQAKNQGRNQVATCPYEIPNR